MLFYVLGLGGFSVGTLKGSKIDVCNSCLSWHEISLQLYLTQDSLFFKTSSVIVCKFIVVRIVKKQRNDINTV